MSKSKDAHDNLIGRRDALRPLEWARPSRNTRKPGASVVCQHHLVSQYVVCLAMMLRFAGDDAASFAFAEET
jgi:hypothetical protein